ncbi:MAG: hypothetical protein Q9212_006856 [Teloschistes hypoglaucus]
MVDQEVLYHQRLVIGVTTFIEILGLTSYVLRLLARRLSGTRLWYDDYIMGVGWMFASTTGICYYIALRYGLGQHVQQVPPKDLENFLICNWIFQLSWTATFPTVKIAVLILYYRLFPGKTFRWVIYGIGTFLLLLLVAGLAGMVFQCIPVQSIWMPQLEHHCFDQMAFYIATGSLNLVTDFFVVLMPIPILWGLQLPPARKYGLVAVFLLAGLACAVSLRRVISLTDLNEADITWTHIGPGLWSAAEAQVLVFCANLPLMGPIVQRLRDMYRPRVRYAAKDEESNKMLDRSSGVSGSSRGQSHGTPHGAQSGAFDTVAMGTMNGGKRTSGPTVQKNQILVEMDMEQRVHQI